MVLLSHSLFSKVDEILNPLLPAQVTVSQTLQVASASSLQLAPTNDISLANYEDHTTTILTWEQSLLNSTEFLFHP